jgi:hypothetical protein
MLRSVPAVLDSQAMKRAPLRGNRVAPISAWGCAAADAKFDPGSRSGLGGSQPEDWERVGRPRVFFRARYAVVDTRDKDFASVMSLGS